MNYYGESCFTGRYEVEYFGSLHRAEATSIMDENERAEESRNLAAQVQTERHEGSTRTRYGNLLGHFKRYITETFPARIEENGDVILQDVTLEEWESFYGHIALKRKRGPFSEQLPPLESGAPQINKAQHIRGYKNAIDAEFKRKKLKLDDAVGSMVSQFIEGWEKRVAKYKQNGDLPITEGKADVTFAGYEYLCRRALRASHDFESSMFAWLFLTHSWNLMSRSNNTSDLRYASVCVYAHAQAHSNACRFTSMHAYIHTQTSHACMGSCARSCACARVHVHVCVRACVCVHVRALVLFGCSIYMCTSGCMLMSSAYHGSHRLYILPSLTLTDSDFYIMMHVHVIGMSTLSGITMQ